MSFQAKQTMVRIAFTLLWVIVIAGYFALQFDAEERFTYFFLNKAVAETAVVFISLSYLLGPVCLLYSKLSRFLIYRRFFGVTGFLFVVGHIVLSLLQWTGRFPWSWYVDRKVGVTGAILATLIFAALALTSKNSIIAAMSSKRWKALQRTGYIALLLTLLHIYFASSRRWGMWWAGEVDMPSSFVVFCVGVSAVIARILAFIVDKIHPRITAASSQVKK
jgi:DMSO/TMAO reductase YedYZ heme-binding membrane subunit